MDQETKLNIRKEFKKNVSHIFKNNLVFGFICGSFARERSHVINDLDFFICVKKNNINNNYKFKKWYYKIHKKYGLKPDKIFPGELMSINILLRKLEKIEKINTPKIIKKNDLYDGIVWSGMLSGDYRELVGDRLLFLKLRKKTKILCKKWKKDLDNNHIEEKPSESIDLFLKRNIKIDTYGKKRYRK